MKPITTDILHKLGIHKSDAEEKALVEHLTDTLNERVGATIIDLLDDDQAQHLIELSEQGDQPKITAWLQETLPEFDQLVKDEYDIVLGELAENAEQV